MPHKQHELKQVPGTSTSFEHLVSDQSAQNVLTLTLAENSSTTTLMTIRTSCRRQLALSRKGFFFTATQVGSSRHRITRRKNALGIAGGFSLPDNFQSDAKSDANKINLNSHNVVFLFAKQLPICPP